MDIVNGAFMLSEKRDRADDLGVVKSITSSLVDKVLSKASVSKTLRAPILLHKTYNEIPQRFVNCLIPSNYMRPHKHLGENQWEVMSWICGDFSLLLFNDEGKLMSKFRFNEKENRVIELPSNCYHTFVTETPSAYLEIRNCAFIPETDRLNAPWAPEVDDPFVADYLNILSKAAVGDILRQELISQGEKENGFY